MFWSRVGRLDVVLGKMASILGALVYLYCSSGCRGGVVASALTFHPPSPPLYDFEEEEIENASGSADSSPPAKKKYNLLLAEDLPQVPREVARSYTSHLITTATGTFVPLVLFYHKDAHFTLIVSHGNASDIGAMFIFYAVLHLRLKVNIVGYDYTGYGVSADYGTRPTEDQTYLDIEAVYDWCCEHDDGALVPTGRPENHLIVYGQSVGSGPSCYLASGRSTRYVASLSDNKFKGSNNKGGEGVPLVGPAGCCTGGVTEVRHVAGMVLHSPIMSGLRVLTMNRCLYCCDIYPNIDLIKTASAPVFVIHGDQDHEVPVRHGIELQDKVPDTHRTPPWWVRDRGHNDVLRANEEEFFRRMKAFLVTVRNRQNRAHAEASQKKEGSGRGRGSGSIVASSPPNPNPNLQARDADTADMEMPGGRLLEMAVMKEKDYADIVVSTATTGGVSVSSKQ